MILDHTVYDVSAPVWLQNALVQLDAGISGHGDGYQRLAVPAYFYPTYFNAANIPWYHTRPPTTDWERMQYAAPYVDFCVYNPASGPGPSINSDYVTQLALAKAAEISTVAYVDTNFAARPIGQVLNDIDTYYAWYPTDGIFFDRASANSGDIPYYQSLYRYVKGKSAGRKLVILNPGTVADQGYMAVCDIICNVETDYASYAGRPITTWEVNYSSRRFWHIIYNIPDNPTRDAILQLTRNFRAGYVYLATLNLPNPFGSLPADSFWKPLVADISHPYALSSTLATPTSGRPSAITSGQGAAIYDSTLSKPIWSDGTVWRDAAGTAV